jgi:hypothetical protein
MDGIAVMIKSVNAGVVEILVGLEKIILNTKTNPSEIVAINSKNYGVEILSGSAIHSLIKLSKCSLGDLSESQVTQQIISNNTIQNNTTTNSTNSSVQN